MAKICTSIEQSKKLTKLELDANTADMCYKCLGEDPYDLIVRPYSDWKEEYKGLLISGDANVIPAWSLSALLELMPQWTLNGFTNGKFNCRDDRAEKYSLVDTCPLDAAFEMISWLLENKKI